MYGVDLWEHVIGLELSALVLGSPAHLFCSMRLIFGLRGCRFRSFDEGFASKLQFAITYFSNTDCVTVLV